MMTEKSKVHKPRSYTTSYFNEKDTLPSYKDISSRVSTKIDPNFQSDKKTSQEILESMGTARRLIPRKEKAERVTKNKYKKMNLQIIYLRKYLNTIGIKERNRKNSNKNFLLRWE